MELAKCFVKLDRFTEVPKFSVTPAEVKILQLAHAAQAGGDPIRALEITGEVERSSIEELSRLRFEYRNLRIRVAEKDENVVARLYNEGSTLPQTFSAIGLKNLKQAEPGTDGPQNNSEPDQGILVNSDS